MAEAEEQKPTDTSQGGASQQGAVSNSVAVAAAKEATSANTGTPCATTTASHLDQNGRPLYLVENVKGSSGSNYWMWRNARLIMKSKEETRSSNCAGAWCLRCEELGKTSTECHLNYHPTRNFKAISRHFKRLHADLSSSREAAPQAVAEKKRSSAYTHPLLPSREKKRVRVALTAVDATPKKSQIHLTRKAAQTHRIISPPAFHPCGEGRLVVVTEHVIQVPLFWSSTAPRGSIDVYFTVVEKVPPNHRKRWEDLKDTTPEQRAVDYVQEAGLASADRMCLFLQGGPGFGAPTPFVGIGFEKNSSWAAAALDLYPRVVLMDQRGTGRSSPVTKQSLHNLFPDLFLLDRFRGNSLEEELAASNPDEATRVQKAVSAAVDFLAQFRAGSIVQDAEAVKEALVFRKGPPDQATPWGCVLGQSFGGFCLMTYLSHVENPARICLFTGGIAPMLTPAYDAYKALWGRVRDRSIRYYDMYPGDIPLVKLIVRSLLEEPVPLPSGGLLTARRFLQVGLSLGGGPRTFPTLHELLSNAIQSADGEDVEFGVSFLKRMDSVQSFDDHPIYFWLHESIYCDGPGASTMSWVAHRAYEDIVKSDNAFDYQYTSSLDDNSIPTLFFGEMVFPWMSDDYEELSGVGMKVLANKLASKDDWGRLYDGGRMKKNLDDGACKAAAAVYHGDMYVDFDASMKVVSSGGPMEKCKVWVTNEYQHSGIRDDGARIFAKLHGMATGSIRVPS